MLARKAAPARRAWYARRVGARASARATQRRQRHRRRPRVDTNVDLAAEFGVDEARLRRSIDRYRLSPGRASGEIDELEALLKPEPIEPAGIAQALAELPRLLSTRAARRMSGRLPPARQLLGGQTPPPKINE